MTIRSVIPTGLALGNRRLFELLFRDVFLPGVERSIEEIRKHCLVSAYGAGSQLEAALQLLIDIGLVARNDDHLRLSESCGDANRDEDVSFSVYRRLIARLVEASEIENYFPPNAISQGWKKDELLIHLSRIPLRAIPVIKLLRDLGVLLDAEEAKSLLRVPSSFSPVLYRALLQSTRQSLGRRSLHPEQLAEIQRAREKQGEEAERYVLALEISRLRDHPNLDLVRRVSAYDCSVGYDIESFQTHKSVFPDRYIEVKSYRGDEHFYISIGEISAAQLLGDQYFLCLVDMNRIGDREYCPEFIRNPSISIAGPSSSWCLSPVSFEARRLVNLAEET